jgi:glycosyltransferase involved in cell wall biosynthesis
MLLKRSKYDWLITVSHPFTGHLVGLALKRRYPTLRWLVDIGDPFCLMEDPSPNNAALYRRLNLRTDHAVLRGADVVSVTTTGTRDAYAGIFPETAAKIHVVPPMLSLPAEITPGSISQKGVSLRLVYVGTLYRTLRSPVPLLELFERLVLLLPSIHLELHFLGHINDCADLFSQYDHWAGSRIFVHGVVSRERAQEHMRAADILINLGNRSSTQLPSKVIEYVAMGKPILNLVTIRGDSSAGILATYPAALTVCMDSSTLPDVEVQKIANFVAQPPEANVKTIRDWLAPYTEQSVSQEYMRLLLSGAGTANAASCKPNTKLS